MLTVGPGGKPEPVMVMGVPPAMGPYLGVTLVTRRGASMSVPVAEQAECPTVMEVWNTGSPGR